jgi:toxin-antitoxin system PIN domain toxin
VVSVTTHLVDVNVLIALAHEDHSAHEKVKRWFRGVSGLRWATCPLTEAGFVRVISNPAYQQPALGLAEVLAMLAAFRALPGHQFWAIDFGFEEALTPFAERFFGHQQVTDIYLLALAVRNKGKLVTLDQGFVSLAGDEFEEFIKVL